MARYSNVTTNFSGGLITDNLAGRKDIDRVTNSCRKLTNFFPSLQGPTGYRQGFQLSYVDATETNTQFRQVHLTVGKDDSYRLVFTDKKLRVFDISGTLIYQWVTAYTETQLNDLRFSSETSVIYICHPNHRPRKFEIKDDISYFFEIDTYIEPFLQEEETLTRLDIVGGEEVAKVESTAAAGATPDFQGIYDDYSPLSIKNISAADTSRVAGTYAAVASTSSGSGTGATFKVVVNTLTIKNTAAAHPDRTGGLYTNVASTSSGLGTGATFLAVVANDGTAIVTVTTIGSGYAVDDTITIADSALGSGGAPNLTFQVATVYDGSAIVTTVANGSGYAVGDTITIANSLLGNGTGAANLTFNVKSLPNSFSKDYYVEYQISDVWLLGKVIDSATNYQEVVGPTPSVVYVDQVDFVTDINDTSAKMYVIDNDVTTSGSDQEDILKRDAVPIGEIHLRTDTDLFESSQLNSWIRVSEQSSSSDVLVDSSSSMTRWVKVEKYLGNEVHPVKFVRGAGVLSTHLGYYDYGSVYKSYGSAQFDVHTGSLAAASTLSAEIKTAGQRTFVWAGGVFTGSGNDTVAGNVSATDVIGNLSESLEFDVHKIDTSVPAIHSGTLGTTASNLIQPTGSINVTEIANDVTITATADIFTAATCINRHLRGVMPTGVVHMQIIARTSDKEVRARLKNPVPRSDVTGGFVNSGRFETFSFGAWYDNNYPADVVSFERRRIYGGTPANPNYVFFSKLDDESTFAPSEDDKTVLDTNGISYPLSNVNSSVRWMIAAKDLIIGTTRGIFSMSVNEYEAAVSPKTIRFELADEVNCKDEAYMVGTSIFFPNESGTQLLEYRYDGTIQRSNANDVSKFIFPILTTDTIKRIAVQETPQPRIWVLTTSGVLYCLTYQRQEDYYAWSKIVMAGQTPVLDLVVLRETYKSGLDQVYIVVNRFGFVQHEVLSSSSDINGTPTIPFSRPEDEPKLFLDSAETGVVGKNTQEYNQVTKTLTITPVNTDVFSSNRRFDLVVSGTYMGNYEIVGGKIQIQMLLEESARWTLGLSYKGEVQPMYPTWDGSNKPSYGSDNQRVISSRAYLIDSSRYSVGIEDDLEIVELDGHVPTSARIISDITQYISDLNDSTGAELTTSDNFTLGMFLNYEAKPQGNFTGFDREKPLRGSYFGVEKSITIEQGEPYPLTIAALVTKTDLN